MSEHLKPVAQIVITLYGGGRMDVSGPPDELLTLGLLEKGKAQIQKHFADAAAGPKLAIPPPGMRLPPMNGKN